MQIQRGPPSPPATSQGRADKIFIPDALLQSETSPGTGFSVPVTWRKGLWVTQGQGLHTQKWGWGAPPPQFSAARGDEWSVACGPPSVAVAVLSLQTVGGEALTQTIWEQNRNLLE